MKTTEEKNKLMLDFIRRISCELLRCDFCLDEKWYDQAKKIIKEVDVPKYRVGDWVVLIAGGVFQISHISENKYIWDKDVCYILEIIDRYATKEEIFKEIDFNPKCLPEWAIEIKLRSDYLWIYKDGDGYYSRIPKEYAPKNYHGKPEHSKINLK